MEKRLVTVETRAYWSCPDCRANNTAEMEEMTPLQLVARVGEEKVRGMLGIEAWQSIEEETSASGVVFDTVPIEVSCVSCGSEFRVDCVEDTEEE